MSIVAMKRKSRGYNQPISGQGSQGFSLTGGYRNQGWVGQTSISRPVYRTIFKGASPVGHGGTSGEYEVSIQSGGMCSANDSSVLKHPTLDTKSHINKILSCNKQTVKYIDPLQSSQEIYIKNLSDKTATCVTDKPKDSNGAVTAGTYNCAYENKKFASYYIGGKKRVALPYSKSVSSNLSYGEYIRSLLLKKTCLKYTTVTKGTSC
jgi:hypothetical protein